MNQKHDLVAAPDSRWQFWIDVGGTFTDCCAKRADGKIRRHKLLSSAVTKGTVGTGSDGRRIVDPARTEDPDNFCAAINVIFSTSMELSSIKIVSRHSKSPTERLL